MAKEVKKGVCITLDEETIEYIDEIGKKILLTDNTSHIIRYAVKFAAMKLLQGK